MDRYPQTPWHSFVAFARNNGYCATLKDAALLYRFYNHYREHEQKIEAMEWLKSQDITKLLSTKDTPE